MSQNQGQERYPYTPFRYAPAPGQRIPAKKCHVRPIIESTQPYFPCQEPCFAPPLKRERESTKFYFPQQCLNHKTRFDPEQPWCISLLSSSPRNNTTAPPKTYPTLRPSPPKNKPNSHQPLSLETACKLGPEGICQGQMLYVHHSKVVT